MVHRPMVAGLVNNGPKSDGHVVEDHRGKTDHGVVQRVCHVHFGLDRDREWHQQQSDP